MKSEVAVYHYKPTKDEVLPVLRGEKTRFCRAVRYSPVEMLHLSGREYLYTLASGEKHVLLSPHWKDQFLWVQEAFQLVCELETGRHYTMYAADGRTLSSGFRPAQEMTKKDSRAQLVVTSVTAKRVHDTTDEDAALGGFSGLPAFRYHWDHRHNRLNSKKLTWEHNPFVWCVQFKLVSIVR